MILGYKIYFPAGGFTNFANKIIHGIKKHSIRIDTNNRWKPGIKIQHAHGVRTKNYMQFYKGECKSVQHIVIEEMIMVETKNCFVFELYSESLKETFIKVFRVKIDNRALTTEEIHLLAKNDGFESTEAFFNWFWNGFDGKIIHWTDLKY